MLIVINISNLFLTFTFKYIKHCHLGQKLTNTFQSKLKINELFKKVLKLMVFKRVLKDFS